MEFKSSNRKTHIQKNKFTEIIINTYIKKILSFDFKTHLGSFQVSLSQKLVKLSPCEIGLLYHCAKKKKYLLQRARAKKKKKKKKQVKKGFMLACQHRCISFLSL